MPDVSAPCEDFFDLFYHREDRIVLCRLEGVWSSLLIEIIDAVLAAVESIAAESKPYAFKKEV